MPTTVRRLRAPTRRPDRWRVAAVIAGMALAGLLFLVGPGSMDVLNVQPSSLTTHLPSWSRPCVIDTPPAGETNSLAFCARAHGRVVGIVTKADSDDAERHVVVTGDFHVTLVELREDMPTPALGSVVTAVGPLQRASFGLRELIALTLHQ
jgi:hypothetical protein